MLVFLSLFNKLGQKYENPTINIQTISTIILIMKNKETNETYFGQETEFDGVLEFTDSLVIAGKFHGTIKSTGNLEIEKTAVCSVDDMSIKSLIVAGKVTGNIHATDRIEFCSGSIVSGDLDSPKLRIADDVEYEGQVTMLEENTEKDLFAGSSVEFKNALVTKIVQAR